jgi:hypothetical protein
VFDRPEIELGIVAPPGQEPRIVEVTFPATTALVEAKTWIARELQDLSVEACGHALRWREDEKTISVSLSPTTTGEGEPLSLPLEEGVVERIVRLPRPGSDSELGWYTSEIVFEKATSWDRTRAEHWLEERLGLRDLGRTAVLTRCYRSRPALARALSLLLHGGAQEATSGGELPCCGLLGPAPAIELIPVTNSGRSPEGRRTTEGLRFVGGGTTTAAAVAPRQRAVRIGGAGLEIDLGSSSGGPRQHDGGGGSGGLPADLRQSLPGQGVINLAEARAIVQALEALVSDTGFRSASNTWQEQQSACSGGRRCEPNAAGGGGSPTVAVLGALPAQVDLLRLLIQRSGALVSSGVPIEVCHPGQFAQRECLVALVSLTRSHTHRAVPFSEHPDDLLRALSRARGRVVLFADPGTMARRSQWHGALDHLDETSGPIEQALMTQLLERLLHEQQQQQEVPSTTRSSSSSSSSSTTSAVRSRESSSV